MSKQHKLQEEKSANLKRFSKIGAAGLAVLSMSAFTDLSGKQLPANVELERFLTDTLIVVEGDTIYSETDTIPPKYGNYPNYSNYSNYSNNYSDSYSDAGYSNNYTNYCDAQ